MEPTILNQYDGLLAHMRALLETDEFVERHRRSKRDFTRQRCLTFVTVVLFLINMVKRALQDELDEFFRAMQQGKVAARTVSKSAFSQARQKLKHTAFIELNQAQVAYFYDHFQVNRWQGWRLLAVDGSLSDVPDTPKLRQHFGRWGWSGGPGPAKARLSQLYDVLNRVTLDACIQPKAKGERELAEEHLPYLGAADLLLLDRGYPAFWLFQAIRRQQAHFCARLEIGKRPYAQRFVASGQAEQLITLKPNYQARQDCRARGLSVDPMSLRLLRVDLPSGDVEVLITSLVDTQRYPHSLFDNLYPHRWAVEEDYKLQKSRLQVENWSGLSVEAVYQDFHATIFTKNLAAILAQPAQPVVAQQTANRTYRYQVNMTNLISKLKDTVLYLFQDPDRMSIFHALWQHMLHTIEPIRPGRSFPRKNSLLCTRFPMTYKSTR